jgi:glutathione synthase/RimK-type ligase-like ATP-grasp enzyme
LSLQRRARWHRLGLEVMKKKILITVNPLITGQRKSTTMRKFITILDRHFDLLVIPVSSYDFKRERVRAYKRLPGGAFKSVGMIEPEGDLWIVYSDGYFLNHRRFGFRLRRDYFNAQIELHQKYLSAGCVRLMINNPEAEARTLKSWLTTLNFKRMKVIPTYLFNSIDEVYDFQKTEKSIVVKPVWGGASTYVRMMTDEACVRKFNSDLRKYTDRDLSDYCFQGFRRGNEKRLWFIGGEFVGGRKYRGRATPWSDWAADCRLTTYDRQSRNGFDADLAAARRLCALSGINVGCIDFIGDEINEINGGGTVLTTLKERKLIVDTRPAFLRYIFELMESM